MQNNQPVNKKMVVLKFVLVINLFVLFVIGITYFISFLLGPPTLLNEQNTVFYSHSGDVIGEEKGSENRYFVDLQDMPDDLLKATIAVEDKNFYDHKGFDIKRIMGALLSDLKSLSLKEGASTLTQQYARNLYLSHEKSWIRKFKEAFYTIRLEMHYSKDQILEGYLNTIYFGHGQYGIEAASQYFFDKPVHELSLAESSMLVGIPKGPTYYSPLNDQIKAKKRQKSTLHLLYKQQEISKEDYFLATHENLVYEKKKETEEAVIGPYFQDTALIESANILDMDREMIRSGGYEIHTTLDISLQKKLETQIANEMDSESKMEVGAIAMNPKNGGIQALIGGRSYEKSPFNRAISAKRMPGSTFKPFLYYAALKNQYTASTKLTSKPTTFVLDDDETYQPRNFNGYYADDSITLAKALALSDNIYAVKTNLFLGTETLIDTAKETFGITSDLPNVPSLPLGTSSVSLQEMVTAYGRLANGENPINGHTIQKIIDRHGKVVFERKEENDKQKLDSANAFILTHLMTGMFDQTLNGYMSVTGSSIADRLTRPYAGKSGTTKFDSWMIGYSPSIVTGIWTGYDNNQLIEKASESALAKNIWASFMEDAHEEKPIENFQIPAGVVSVEIDPETGEIATPYCPSSRTMYFKKGTAPKTHCTKHFPDENLKKHHDDNPEDKGLFERLFELLR